MIRFYLLCNVCTNESEPNKDADLNVVVGTNNVTFRMNENETNIHQPPAFYLLYPSACSSRNMRSNAKVVGIIYLLLRRSS